MMRILDRAHIQVPKKDDLVPDLETTNKMLLCRVNVQVKGVKMCTQWVSVCVSKLNCHHRFHVFANSPVVRVDFRLVRPLCAPECLYVHPCEAMALSSSWAVGLVVFTSSL